MGNLNMQEILPLTQKHPELSLQQILKFITLASKMKNDIILVQPTSVPTSNPLIVLPPAITLFLKNSCGISEACVASCWKALRSTVWCDSDTFKDNSESDFAEHSHSIGLCALPRESGHEASTDNYLGLDTLYPPQHTCTNASCSQSETGKLLE
jgi:hypothetical protein